MLEKIINKTKVGLVVAALSLGAYGCGTFKTGYFKPRPANQVYVCDEDNMRHMYCDDDYIYPAVVVEFK